MTPGVGRRPFTSRNETNVELVKKIVQMISDKLQLNQNSILQIITEELGMHKVCAEMVPKLWNDVQKMWRMQVCCLEVSG